MAGVARGTKVSRDHQFSLRLRKACDDNPQIPPYNRGRQAWVRTQLAERFGVSVSNETVSKWFTGVARPRPDKVRVLAQLIEVDEAWLALGVAPDVQPRERKLRNAMADGAVNVLAGFVQMCGGHPAFPEEDGAAARGGAHVDLYAIIKGAHYSFHVALGQEAGPNTYRFVIPYGYEELIVIGLVQREPLVCDFLELAHDMIEKHGVRRGGAVEVTIANGPKGYVTGRDAWPRIRTFAERL